MAFSRLEGLRTARFADVPADCHEDLDPGITEIEEWHDWFARDTTADQLRIEDYLERTGVRNLSILHIGVGNSSLASRFSEQAAVIVGTTLSPNEKHAGEQLGLPNYSVHIHNKFSADRPLWGPRRFDVIVDNNPTTFCCCWRHFSAMMESYAQLLKPGGKLVTDRVGLGWVASNPKVSRRWRFSFDDLSVTAEAFGLKASAVDEFTYRLDRPMNPARRLIRRIARPLRKMIGR